MTRSSQSLLLAVFLVSCAAEEPAPRGPEKRIEGVWMAKVRAGELTFIQDTLDLRAGGSGTAHRLEYTLRPNPGGAMDSTVTDFGHKAITWEITTDPTGRNLCVAGQNGPQADCGPLSVVSDSVMNLGNFPYRLLAANPRP